MNPPDHREGSLISTLIFETVSYTAFPLELKTEIKNGIQYKYRDSTFKIFRNIIRAAFELSVS